jgi:hypothetical protein
MCVCFIVVVKQVGGTVGGTVTERYSSHRVLPLATTKAVDHAADNALASSLAQARNANATTSTTTQGVAAAAATPSTSGGSGGRGGSVASGVFSTAQQEIAMAAEATATEFTIFGAAKVRRSNAFTQVYFHTPPPLELQMFI